MPALLVEGVSFAYTEKAALDDVSFAVRPGRFAALLGPNGAGKSTLFALITRLLRTDRGRIAICGLDVNKAGAAALAPLGVVFQQPTLDLDLTVAQNLRYFARLRGLGRREMTRRIDRELGRFEMRHRAAEKVRALNGGHRRRVEIARALLGNPSLLLLDEPTVGLDVPSRKAIVEHVHDLAASEGIAVLWATHLIDEIRRGDDLVILHRGRIAEKGPVEEVLARTRTAGLEDAFAALTAPRAEAA
ncbi:ATP-binding cassette domain-containing protein [Faunimonas sp. B44]|uniref:ATP-binding cassette domain-containing protein n=1 Tax=Faunimonas sp. B44 TaxID=3461493 RepID=UPI004044EF06